MKLSSLHSARWGFFVAVGFAFGARDMCLGSGGPPPEDPPVDAPSDAPPDGTMSHAPKDAPPVI